MDVMSTKLLVLPLLLVLAAGIGLAARRGSPEPSTAEARARPAKADGAIRGITISTPTYNREWASDATAEAIARVGGLGAGWIAFHPYAQIRADGSVAWRPIDPEAPPAWLTRPIEEAHRRGMRVMVKPHLAYWGSPWSWRGDIDLEGEAVARFFADYGRWIEQVAAATAEADLFVVATELDRLAENEAQWRAVIARVRAVHPAPLTWAANHDRYTALPFWDALDYVGVQAYFPLMERGEPTRAALEAGWARVSTELRHVSERTGKPVLLTELGYNRSARAPFEPWAYEQGGEGAEEVQARCLEVALAAVEAEPAIAGAFLWKWLPGEPGRGDFGMWRPGPRGVIGAAWR